MRIGGRKFHTWDVTAIIALYQVLRVRALQAGVVAAGGDEGDALRVALLEDGIEQASNGGGISAAVIGRGEVLLADPKRRADHVRFIVLHDLSVAGQQGIELRSGTTYKSTCAPGAPPRAMSTSSVASIDAASLPSCKPGLAPAT
ncbi:hypothetical protein IXO159_05570 [Xanthomonas oryzae pv. oryzae]|nr:hypothetical protein DXO216_15115 [Xanthomonas oryzae pv. oryzae]OLI17208.1 hypothetical protein IXO90_18760 [Xanthomonas oryzae pv. oryzae]OLI17406.1 hypothetical protein DXO226_11330 [Xanthomonas oryzae pv. oryzae]OLI30286.1 hypothetical protein IXO93_06900 [Xanthomonas oryzae pv. oryzae]OLI67548.1 hypothetical protein IXO159_05570 [Xanthomonas oryzae pv. oryzae]